MPSPIRESQRRRHPPHHPRRRALRIGTAAAVCLTVAAGVTAAQHLNGTETEDSDSAAAAHPGRPLPPSASPSGLPFGETPPILAPPEPGRPAPPSAPPTGRLSSSGTFITAAGESERAGKGGILQRYKVSVEDGIALAPGNVADTVEHVLADKRGWTADGRWAFQRVASGPYDFVIRLATPQTVDRICGKYGLDTGGEVNCRVGKEVMVNLKRWRLATKFYTDDVTGYRALIINHEVGHFLGEGHMTCPGPGRPAPVMMQQVKGLKGCKPNVWPFDGQGHPLKGPAVP